MALAIALTAAPSAGADTGPPQITVPVSPQTTAEDTAKTFSTSPRLSP